MNVLDTNTKKDILYTISNKLDNLDFYYIRNSLIKRAQIFISYGDDKILIRFKENQTDLLQDLAEHIKKITNEN